MTVLSFEDLVEPLTTAEVSESIYDVLAIVGANTTTWKPGGVVRTIIACMSVVIASLSSLTAAIAKMGILELSTGSWLTHLALGTYNVTRTDATHATGTWTCNNTSGNTYVLAVGDLVVSNPALDKTYRNSESTTILPGATAFDIAIEAIEAGSGSTSVPGGITEMVTTLLGVSGSNLTAVVGSDAEIDSDLRARCDAKLGSLSPDGPRDAYSYVARTATDVDGNTIGVTRTKVVPDGLGGVDIYCATATGGVTGTYTNPLTDLGRIHDAILDEATPHAVTPTTHSAAGTATDITYTAHAYSTIGLTAAQLVAEIDAAITDFISTRPIGGDSIPPTANKLYHDAIRTTIGRVRHPYIFHVDLTTPAADVSIPATEAPTVGSITGSATLYAPPAD